MKLNINPNWLLQMAEKEDCRIVSVGGIVARVEAESKPMSTLKRADKMAEWSRAFPIKAMKKNRFSLPSGVPDFDALLNFFDVLSPDAWRETWKAKAAHVAFRQTRVMNTREEAVSAWVREAEIIAQQIPLADFNANKLRASLNELRKLTRRDAHEALTEAQAICAWCGVALVIVPELPGTRISGCARWLSDSHALIGLTLRYKSGDQLWFTFFHELAHILLHRDQHSFVLDNAVGDIGDNVVDPDMAQYEVEANRFAADTLIPSIELAKLPLHNPSELVNEIIQDFAASIDIHPGIVIGRLQHDKILQQWQGNKLKQTLEWGFKSEE